MVEKKPSESDLTAELMYKVMDELLVTHYSRDRIITTKKNGVYRYKFWGIPDVRKPLEEFVDSYFFTDLGEPLSGFKEIFQCGKDYSKKNIDDYLTKLEHEYGREESLNIMNRLLENIIQRGDKINQQLKRIPSLEGVGIVPLVRDNALDGFDTLVNIVYLHIQMVHEYFRKNYSQS